MTPFDGFSLVQLDGARAASLGGRDRYRNVTPFDDFSLVLVSVEMLRAPVAGGRDRHAW